MSTLKNKFTYVWILLIAITLISWTLADSYIAGDTKAASIFTIIIILLAFFKVAMVVWHFMEIKIAPLPLKVILTVWIIGVCAAILFLYFNPGVF